MDIGYRNESTNYGHTVTFYSSIKGIAYLMYEKTIMQQTVNEKWSE